MNIRPLGATGIRVGEIGMGCEGFIGKTRQEVREFLDVMERSGANLIDLYSPDPEMRSALGEAMAGRRDSFVLQAHLCTIWKDGQYERTRDIGEVRQSFEDQLARLGTSWVDIAMIHYVDSVSDWNAVESGEVMHYAQALRREGRARRSAVQPQPRGGAAGGGERENRCADVQCQPLLRPAACQRGCGASLGGGELCRATGQYGPGAGGALRGMPTAGRGHHGDEGLRRRRPAERRTFACREGVDAV